MQATEYEIHAAANIFPMMTDAEFVEFKEDIAQHGVREPIVLLDGKLIDGRNRLKACNELGIEPMESELTEDVDPVAYVMSVNLHRRHLTESQRAICAAKLATLKNGQHGKALPNDGAFTVEQTAGLFQVGARSVERGKKVLTTGSKELVEAVERGDVPVSLAAKFVNEVPDKREQTKILKQGKSAVRDAVKPTCSTPDKKSSHKTTKENKKPEADELLGEFRELWNRSNKTQKMAIRAMVLSEDKDS